MLTTESLKDDLISISNDNLEIDFDTQCFYRNTTQNLMNAYKSLFKGHFSIWEIGGTLRSFESGGNSGSRPRETNGAQSGEPVGAAA